jgi:hypothetical protein
VAHPFVAVLRPPGLSSSAPIEMPAGVDVPPGNGEARVESGDVMPIPGAVMVATWADPCPNGGKTETAVAIARLAVERVSLRRIGFT